MRNETEFKVLSTRSFDDARVRTVMDLYDEFGLQVASGTLPRWYYAAESLASLLPIVKKQLTDEQVEAGREPDARPIAVDEVGLRAILASVTDSVTSAMADVLAPQQVAVGVQGGISIMIHGIRLLLEQRCVWLDASPWRCLRLSAFRRL